MLSRRNDTNWSLVGEMRVGEMSLNREYLLWKNASIFFPKEQAVSASVHKLGIPRSKCLIVLSYL